MGELVVPPAVVASVFSRFAPRLQEAIVARLGWSSLREVQELAGRALLEGANAIVLAPTAGGKTEAALFPALSQLITEPVAVGRVGIIYIAPIRALLNNQADRLGLYTEMIGLDRFVWHGDTTETERKRFLREPVELLMTTPESLEVMLLSRRVDARALFADLRMVVVDEVHAMAGTDRGSHLASVLERLTMLAKRDVQRVGLSATVGNPESVLAWLQGTSTREGVVVDPPRPKARREVRIEYLPESEELARSAAELAADRKSFVFCESRATAERVAEQMAALGTAVFVHHSAVSRAERLLAEEKFQGKEAGGVCIVCTSTLELGIDVGDLDRVMQVDAPKTVSSFLQRMGRTGRRAGQTANTTFLATAATTVVQAVAVVALARAGWVESIGAIDRAWPVLVHQLIALALEDDGTPVEGAWKKLSRVKDFAGIRRAEFDRLIEWLVRDESLVVVAGRLVIGPKVEKLFGRRHFRELYAVFESPQSYTVVTVNQQVIGTLEQDFVDMLVEDETAFLLAGRGWWVQQILHDERRVLVSPAPKGKEPAWGGILPRFLSFEVCQAMLAVTVSDVAHGWLSAAAAEALVDWREGLAGVVVAGRGGLDATDGSVRWWTFAGGRINQTLRLALGALEPSWKVRTDNLGVAMGRDDGSVTLAEAGAVIERLADPETWEDAALWRAVAARLPNYRLSKFQVLMPPWVVHEMLATYLIDVAGAARAAARLMGVGVGREGLERVPAEALVGPDVGLVPVATEPWSPDERALQRDPRRRVVWIEDGAALAEAVIELGDERVLGLDVETTLSGQVLCLMQIAGAATTWLVDTLAVSDLGPLRDILAAETVTKLVHNAQFERAVLGRHAIVLGGVIDTLELSRERRGKRPEGHSLNAVCRRELGAGLDKRAQTSDWSRRPLEAWQRDYAALDAEVLHEVQERLVSGHASGD